MANRGLMAMAAISGFILACPTGPAASQEHTPRQLACDKARLGKQCETDAKECYFKFTVAKVVDQKNLNVTYPPSVWSVTKADMKDKKEEDYEKDKKNKEFPIQMKSGTAIQGKTYFFTRCPDNEFTLGQEIDPNDMHEDRQPKP